MIAASTRWMVQFSFAAMVLWIILISVRTEVSTDSVSPLHAISTEFVNGSNLQSFVVRTRAYSEIKTVAPPESRLRSQAAYNSAAADWERFPPGTVFRIPGESTLYVVDDYASHLVGTNTIDIYRPSEASARQWGERNVTIEVIKIGDINESRKLLESHRSWHRQMASHSDSEK